MKAAIAEIAQSFARDGFAIVPNLFRREEVKVFKEDIQKILQEVKQESEGEDSPKKHVDDTGVYVGLAARSGLFRQAVSDERLLDILEAILGPNVEFLSDKVVFKDTERHVASPWHQDWPYWEGTHKISVWVALDDATPENGCLKLLPGSHLGSVIHDGDRSDGSGFGHRIRPETVEESAAISAPVEAGGAVFFHDLTMHASHPNTERRERWTWVPTFRDAQGEDPPYSFAVANYVVRGVGRE
jgi:phytanoyl-CoA hydroxylase